MSPAEHREDGAAAWHRLTTAALAMRLVNAHAKTTSPAFAAPIPGPRDLRSRPGRHLPQRRHRAHPPTRASVPSQAAAPAAPASPGMRTFAMKADCLGSLAAAHHVLNAVGVGRVHGDAAQVAEVSPGPPIHTSPRDTPTATSLSASGSSGTSGGANGRRKPGATPSPRCRATRLRSARGRSRSPDAGAGHPRARPSIQRSHRGASTGCSGARLVPRSPSRWRSGAPRAVRTPMSRASPRATADRRRPTAMR